MPHIDSRVNELYLALGEFAMKFAAAENQLKMACVLLGNGSSNSSINILIQGMTARPCIEFIRKCHKFNNITIDEKINSTLSQLLIISKQRNKLLHDGFIHTDKGFVNRKFLMMAFENEYKEEIFTTKDLNDMTHDLEIIEKSLVVIRYSLPAQLVGLNDRPPSLEWLRSFQLPSLSPWRYKSNQN